MENRIEAYVKSEFEKTRRNFERMAEEKNSLCGQWRQCSRCPALGRRARQSFLL
jgi:hypothetical protein